MLRGNNTRQNKFQMNSLLRLRLRARYKVREQLQIRVCVCVCVCVCLRVGPMSVGCAGCCLIFGEVESLGCCSFFGEVESLGFCSIFGEVDSLGLVAVSFSLTTFFSSFFLIISLLPRFVFMILRFRPGIQSGIKKGNGIRNGIICSLRDFAVPE